MTEAQRDAEAWSPLHTFLQNAVKPIQVCDTACHGLLSCATGLCRCQGPSCKRLGVAQRSAEYPAAPGQACSSMSGLPASLPCLHFQHAKAYRTFRPPAVPVCTAQLRWTCETT